MSGRSPSAVASLRARFEENSKLESPPSRGRSPAGSVASDSSRPISRVRTSFISVEPSGQMSHLLGTGENAKTEKTIAGDGIEESKAQPSIADAQPFHGGLGSTAKPQASEKESPNSKYSQSTQAAPMPGKGSGTAVKAAAVNPDKPTSVPDDAGAKLLPSDPKEEKAVSGGGALGQATPGLGSILKGSPFEKRHGEEGTIKTGKNTQKAEPSILPLTGSAPVQPLKPTIQGTAGSIPNGKPKEPAVVASQAPAEAKSKDQAPKQPHTSTEPAGTTASRASKSDGKVSEPKFTPEKLDASSKKPAKSAASPRTPTSTNGAKKAPATTASRNEEAASKVKSAGNKVKAKASEAKSMLGSSNTKTAPVKDAPSTTTTSKPSAHKSIPPPSSSSEFKKPKPKSPTRPVRLPSHLTAPTAASAAKLDHSAPAASQSERSPSRASNASTTKALPSKPATAATARLHRPPRASMPAAGTIKPREREKPKVRQSLAGGTKPAGSTGSFLERMMRPTQSSAQKTHDKLEVAGKHSPPSKRVTSGSRNVSLNLDDKKKISLPTTKKTSASGTTDTAAAGENEDDKVNPSTAGVKDITASGPTTIDLKDAPSSTVEHSELGTKSTITTSNPASVDTPSVPSSEKPIVAQPASDVNETF